MTAQRTPVWGQLSERDFMAQVIDYARLMGWLIFHPFDSRHSEAGFPDLICLRGPRIVAIELKAVRGRVTSDQARWLDAFVAASVETHVFRPSQWDEVVECLNR